MLIKMKIEEILERINVSRVVGILIIAVFFFSGFLHAFPNKTPMSLKRPLSSERIYKLETQADYEKAKARIYTGGDQILFKRGVTYKGAMSLQRSNLRPDVAIKISDFGDKQQTRPVIHADAPKMGTLDIRDSGGWIIENLELINYSENRSQRHGIYISATDSGTYSDFTIRNNIIRDVAGEPGNKNNGGIIIRVWGRNKPTRFTDILIENNQIRDISGVGIRIKSPWEIDPTDPRRKKSNAIGRYAFQNVVVRKNQIKNTTKNALIVASSDKPLIEYNMIGPNISTEVTGNSLFVFATDDALVQYNEAFGNMGPAVDKDRCGFDADYNSRNSVFQFNYSHDNNCAFAIMRRYQVGLKIRYNVSQNDKYGFFFYGFPTEKGLVNAKIYNNTMYSEYKDMHVFMNFDPMKHRIPINSEFRNNIFVFAKEGATWGAEPLEELGNRFSDNLIFGLDEPNHRGPSIFPRFRDANGVKSNVDMTDPAALDAYKLCEQTSLSSHSGVSDNVGAFRSLGIDCDDIP